MQKIKHRLPGQPLMIKVCGMRDPDNIRDLLELQPDFMGMIFYPASKRYVGDKPAVLGKLLHQPPPNATVSGTLKTGVFVNATPQGIMKTIRDFQLDAVQLHGAETSDQCMKLRDNLMEQAKSSPLLIKAFGIDRDFEWPQLKGYEGVIDFLLFDTRTPTYGGSGKKFDWSLLAKYHGEIPYFISGGIGKEDLPAVMEMARKDRRLVGIDLNSQYELKPGCKSIEKLIETFKYVRNEK